MTYETAIELSPLLGLFFIGLPFSVLVLYILIRAREHDKS